MDRHKVVVVTGASAGVGRATVRAFAREGARIGLVARGHAGLEAARREVEELGGEALVLSADVANADDVEQAADLVEEAFGGIDIWVNNAMCSVFAPASKMTPADYRRVTEVTYLGYVYGTLAALKRMRPRDQGIIIQVGSVLAYRGIPLQSAYCAAKHAIQGFTEALRCELINERSNVRISMVQMPALNTPQFDWVRSRLPRKPQPVPPIFQPEVAADAIVHASRHYRREWYVGASTALVVTANKFVPGLGDWYLGRQGYDAQQYDGEVAPDRRDNLVAPVDDEDDYGAHGDFDDRAADFSYQLWLDQRRLWVLWAGLAALARRHGRPHGQRLARRPGRRGPGALGTLALGRLPACQSSPRAAPAGAAHPHHGATMSAEQQEAQRDGACRLSNPG